MARRFGGLIVILAAVASLLGVFAAPALAAYPERALSVIIPFGAGGASDQLIRAWAEAMKPFFPRPIAVVTKPGGAGSVGSAEVLRSRPDGYTIGYGYSPVFTLQPQLGSQLPYQGPQDSQPIVHLAYSTTILLARSEAGWSTVKDMVSHAKANPGKVKVGTLGSGALSGMVLAQLKQKAAVDLTEVTFSGGAESVTAVLGGHVDAAVANMAEVIGHVRAGKLKVLAIVGKKRSPGSPDTGTFIEQGYEITQSHAFGYLFGPKGLPEPIVQFLHDASRKAMDSEGFKKACDAIYFISDPMSPAELRAALDRDTVFFGEMVKQLKLKK